MSKENKSFAYTYSANEQAEIKKIREKYATPDASLTNKMEMLRKMDASVTRKGTVVSLIFGFVGTLFLGFGMSLAMSELSAILGSHVALAMPIGIAVGLFGILVAALAYPAYTWITARERKRIAPEILRLTDELMK